MNKDNEWVSFSETDSNGVFREAYGYFENRETGFQRESMDEIRDRISKLPAGKQACNFDSHDFTRIDEFTGGIKYKCRNCGLEAVRFNCSYEFDLAFLGSYVDNCSYKWHSDEMDTSKVVKIQVSFGDYPIRNIEYDSEKGSIRYKNTINGSRDGGLRHPNGFFEPHISQPSDAQGKKLLDTLKTVDFTNWGTDISTIKNMRVGSCGFCIHSSIRMLFENGRSFIAYCCAGDDFNKITATLMEMCNIKAKDNSVEEITADVYYCCGKAYPANMQFCTVCGRKLRVPPPKPKENVPGIITECCNSKVPEYCKFCPECGSEIKNKEKLTHLDIEYDMDQTMWLCECLSSNAFSDKYCRGCGKKRGII